MPSNSHNIPKVSVVMITYNHEKFIAQAIEGVLMQKLNLPIELVIGEDCSTDRTREIALEFQQRCPETIRVLTPESNLGVGRNVIACINACKGEYIAICEGDDFWTDPHKLAKQIEVFDSQQDAALCFHRVAALDDVTGEHRGDFPIAEFRKRLVTLTELIRKNFIVTCSVLFRRAALPILDDGFAELKVADWALFILLAKRGNVVYLDEAMAQYRIHHGGVWTAGSPHDRTVEIIRTLRYVLPKLKFTEKLELRRVLSSYCLRMSREVLRIDDRTKARKFLFLSLFYQLTSGDLRIMKQVRLICNMYLPSMTSAFRIMKSHL